MIAVRKAGALAVIILTMAAGPALSACEDNAEWAATAISTQLAAARPLNRAEEPLPRPTSAFTLALDLQRDVTFALPPEREPRKDTPQAGVVAFAEGAPGRYHVALSASAWIDVVQHDTRLPDVAFASFTECPDLRKIVAFDIGPGPFTLQISDAETTSIAVAITAAP